MEGSRRGALEHQGQRGRGAGGQDVVEREGALEIGGVQVQPKPDVGPQPVGHGQGALAHRAHTDLAKVHRQGALGWEGWGIGGGGNRLCFFT